jgi:Bacterial SH3 domain
MKQCPHCSAEYEDNVTFCTSDGKSLVMKTGIRTKLCPHCANSIAADAFKCPYCKAELTSTPAPQWATHEEDSLHDRVLSEKNKTSMVSKAILAVGLLVFAVGVFLIGGQRQRSESGSLLDEKLRELRDKDQKIESLERELAQARKELTENSTQLTELKAKLDESQKDLASAQQRLGNSARDDERLAANRAKAPTRVAARSAESLAQSTPSAPARRVAEPGVYETIRATSVHEDPSASSRVLSQVSKGTRINVVGSVGGWLEVRSKVGNPPGFLRLDDAMFVAKANQAP